MNFLLFCTQSNFALSWHYVICLEDQIIKLGGWILVFLQGSKSRTLLLPWLINQFVPLTDFSCCLLCLMFYDFRYLCSVPDDFKVNPGPVEAIAVHPTNPNKVQNMPQNDIWWHLVLCHKKTLTLAGHNFWSVRGWDFIFGVHSL